MSESERPRLPAGRPLWDPWNGARVGALVGGLLGIVVALLLSTANFLAAPIGAVFGAVLGYRNEKHKQQKGGDADG